MHGNFFGADYRLLGRIVMGAVDNGEAYYWNEFYLESRGGKTATLVYEATERGGVWRLFTEFEPEHPLTAADAATKQVGDKLNLTGSDVRVTLRDSSCVYHIEGQAPAGVAVGDAAEYFNAEATGVMQVVSWTGDEVEYYNGVNLSPGVVNSAFNLPFTATSSASASGFFSALNGSSSDNYSSAPKFILQAVALVVLFFIIFGRSFSCTNTYESAPVKKILAEKPPLAVGAAGELKGKHYRITGHAVVELDEAGLIFERHEYQLADDLHQTALLVCGQKPGDKNWTLFTALAPLLPPSPQECAAKKIGDVVNVDGVTGPIRDIFQATVRSADGTTAGALLDGRECFGYLAQSEYGWLLVRWDRNEIFFLGGTIISATAAKAVFSDTSWK